MIKIDMDMPSCCDDCWALDESGDYPMCRINSETKGYNFNVRDRRMTNCPLIEEEPLYKQHCAKPIKLEELRNAPNGYIGWINYSADGNYIKFITSFDGFSMHDDPIEGKISMIDFEDSLYCEPESDYGKTYVLWDDKPSQEQIYEYWRQICAT